MSNYPFSLEESTKRYCWYRAQVIKDIEATKTFKGIDAESVEFFEAALKNIIELKSSERELKNVFKNDEDAEAADTLIEQIWCSYKGIQKTLQKDLVSGKVYSESQIENHLSRSVFSSLYADFALYERQEMYPAKLKLFRIDYEIIPNETEEHLTFRIL